jgi:hypothetical protein
LISEENFSPLFKEDRRKAGLPDKKNMQQKSTFTFIGPCSYFAKLFISLQTSAKDQLEALCNQNYCRHAKNSRWLTCGSGKGCRRRAKISKQQRGTWPWISFCITFVID